MRGIEAANVSTRSSRAQFTSRHPVFGHSTCTEGNRQVLDLFQARSPPAKL